MAASTSPTTPLQEFVLTNEFASVKVQLECSTGQPKIQVTDLATGSAASLDPVGAFLAGRGKSSTDEASSLKIEGDYQANGPRLKITAAGSGQVIYLDPLELSDAAITGVWGKLPRVYEVL